MLSAWEYATHASACVCVNCSLADSHTCFMLSSLSHPRSADAHRRDEVRPHTKLLSAHYRIALTLSCALSQLHSLSLSALSLAECAGCAESQQHITSASHSFGRQRSEWTCEAHARSASTQSTTNKLQQQFRYSRKRNNNNNIANRVRVSRVRRASWVVSQLQFLHIVCCCCCCLCMLRRAWNIATTITTKGTTKRKII